MSEDIKVSIQWRDLHTHDYCDIVHDSQIMESAYVSISGGTDEENVAYIHSRVFLSHQDEKNHVNFRKKWMN
jgi:hypothetical protein